MTFSLIPCAEGKRAHAVWDWMIRGAYDADRVALRAVCGVEVHPDNRIPPVTRYTLDRPGERHPESLYVKGRRQEIAHLSDDRATAANGYLRHPTLRTPTRRM